MKPILIPALLLLLISACERPEEASMYLSSTTDMQCKSGGTLKTGDPTPNQSCVRFEFDGDSTLYLVHYNAGFNCCPEKILTDMQIKGDSIIITEDDLETGCRCNCLYHINLTIHNLKETRYHVKIIEPLARVEDRIVFDLDLKKKPKGDACVDRDYYPWGI